MQFSRLDDFSPNVILCLYFRYIVLAYLVFRSLTANTTYTFAFSIVLGDLATIRSYAYQVPIGA
jgi:hypothetical protein